MTKWRKVKKIVKSKEIFDLNLIIQTHNLCHIFEETIRTSNCFNVSIVKYT